MELAKATQVGGAAAGRAFCFRFLPHRSPAERAFSIRPSEPPLFCFWVHFWVYFSPCKSSRKIVRNIAGKSIDRTNTLTRGEPENRLAVALGLTADPGGSAHSKCGSRRSQHRCAGCTALRASPRRPFRARQTLPEAYLEVVWPPCRRAKSKAGMGPQCQFVLGRSILRKWAIDICTNAVF